jgi:tetratricopeptide (TPR) repeat protein
MAHPVTKSGARTLRLLNNSEDELRFEVETLQSAILARERKGLRTPIHNEQDFRDRLTQIKRAYKQTAFDPYLATATRELHKYLKQIAPEETYDYWKSRNLLYELNEVFTIGSEIKEQTANDAQKTFEELRARSVRWDKHTSLSNEERKILREKVLFCACRGNELRRRGETTLALKLFEWLLDFTNSKLLKTDTFPCYSTRATLCYYIGATLRTLEHHRRAEAKFSEALNFLYARGKRLGALDHLYVSRKQAIVVGLGFGLTNMTRGFLDRAEHALSTARSMLASVADPSVSSYVELLYATVLRCRAGSNTGKLKVVISELKQTRRTFSNPRFQARTCWELALAMTIIGDIDGAKEHLATVSNYADASNNRKWQVNVQILNSRISQKERKIKEALDFAEEAVAKAKSPECNSVLPLVDAYITRGEAHLLKGDITKSDASYTEARENFESALNCILETRGGSTKADYLSNPKIAGVCTLRIAECYARTGKQLAAQKQFAIWTQLAPHVEHEWVRELAVRVRAELDKLAMDFTISSQDSQNWNYAASVGRLRQWLLTRALRKTNQNYSEAAKLLGVQRTTLYQWLTQEDKTKSRARTVD